MVVAAWMLLVGWCGLTECVRKLGSERRGVLHNELIHRHTSYYALARHGRIQTDKERKQGRLIKKTVKKGATVVKVLEQAQFKKIDFKSVVSAGELEHADVMDFAPAGGNKGEESDDDKDLSEDKQDQVENDEGEAQLKGIGRPRDEIWNVGCHVNCV